MKKISIIAIIILFLICIYFVNNNYSLYKHNILHITNVTNKKINSDFSDEIYYEQTIKGILKNGNNKNKTYTLKNTASTSKVFDDKYYKGNDLFVELSNDGKTIVGVLGVKRDKYVIPLILLFIILIIYTASFKGLLVLISLLFNIILSILAVYIYKNNIINIGILPLYMIVSILFICLSLFITNGKGKKTNAAIISSICSLFISFGLCFIIIKIFESSIPFWSMSYIETVFEYENFFYVSVLLSGLGAIMDIAVTLASSINELVVKNNNISLKQLIKSGKEISKDISGTMCNIMLFTCFTSIIPMVVLATRNYMSLTNALTHYGELELIIVLTSCISIVLTIPISLYISSYILVNKEVK